MPDERQRCSAPSRRARRTSAGPPGCASERTARPARSSSLERALAALARLASTVAGRRRRSPVRARHRHDRHGGGSAAPASSTLPTIRPACAPCAPRALWGRREASRARSSNVAGIARHAQREQLGLRMPGRRAVRACGEMRVDSRAFGRREARAAVSVENRCDVVAAHVISPMRGWGLCRLRRATCRGARARGTGAL